MQQLLCERFLHHTASDRRTIKILKKITAKLLIFTEKAITLQSLLCAYTRI